MFDIDFGCDCMSREGKIFFVCVVFLSPKEVDTTVNLVVRQVECLRVLWSWFIEFEHDVMLLSSSPLAFPFPFHYFSFFDASLISLLS